MFPSTILSNRQSSQRQLSGAVTCTVPSRTIMPETFYKFGEQAKWKQTLNKHSTTKIIPYSRGATEKKVQDARPLFCRTPQPTNQPRHQASL